ncbi:TonB-dependent receptor domain-containing protein [Mucilaginibacter sp.]|uniref:TonB-dependent receptor domain-containing protein n=1 Tax=Mucilaginibacter sp. TaxID=1882438 RepID=UPI002847C65F|nr:TonB-dependent receptor [Mucilaginibacter sp.]MDR3693064.1 TonB-dependent receptor [Mucilaginibacter sp.]
MKNFIILLLLIAVSYNLKAQNSSTNGKITGKVIDAVTKQPVDFATISIFKQGSTSPFNGGSTDPKGNFKIDNIMPGDYMVTVDFIGYKQYKIAHVVVLSTNKNLSLGEILLAPVQTQLKEVSVTASAPTVSNKIDKLVYSPANDLTSQGGVALDVLQKVPMVSVDINGNVELMGNANIQFLINGKPSTIFGASITDALQAIPASQIKSIEVITNPGAKYDAAGTGGIINIVLKDNNIQGVNGSVNLTAGTRLENANFNINAKKGKFGVNAFFGGNANLTSATPSSGNRTSYSNSRDTVTNLGQNGISNFKRSGYRSGISFNWDISPKDNLSASVNFDHFGNNSNGYVNNYQTTSIGGGLPIDTNSVNNSTNRFSNNSTDLSLSYKKTFAKKDQELDVLLEQSFGHTTNNYSQEQDYTNVSYPPLGSIGDNPGSDKETNIAIDYVQPVTEDFTIETGAKLGIENINSTVNTLTLDTGVYKYNPLQSYKFNYNRKIYAYYLSVNFSLFNKFLDGKAGLRDEYTVSTSDFPNTIIPSYNILAPSFVLSHKLDKTESIKFSYSYRLERPEYRSLNPFYNISDPHNISTGNPELKPELGHNFELGYNKSFAKGANIYVAAFYRYNTNDIQSFTTVDSTLVAGGVTYHNVALTQSYNLGREATEGINLFISLPATDKLSLRSNMFFADRISDNPGSPQVSGFMYRINLNTSYEFAKDLAAEFFINYRSSQRGIQGTNPAFLFYNFAVRKQFMNKKASIGLTAANPFNQYVNVNSTTYGANFNQNSLRQIPLRSFGISLMYKFGKLEFKKDRDQQDNAAPDDAGGGGGGGK